MFKIGRKASVAISRILAIFVFLCLLAAVFLLPGILNIYLDAFDRIIEDRTPVLCILYAILMPAFIAVFNLWKLLQNVSNESVFSVSSVSCLRALSWCCFAECVLFGILTCWFMISAAIVFACAFMGMILRVVKNVIDEGVALKTENDYTI